MHISRVQYSHRVYNLSHLFSYTYTVTSTLHSVIHSSNPCQNNIKYPRHVCSHQSSMLDIVSRRGFWQANNMLNYLKPKCIVWHYGGLTEWIFKWHTNTGPWKADYCRPSYWTPFMVCFFLPECICQSHSNTGHLNADWRSLWIQAECHQWHCMESPEWTCQTS